MTLFKWLWLMLLPMIMTGCATSRDKQLWSVGVIVYGLYLFGLLMTFAVPALHQNRYFKRVIEAMNKPAVVLAMILIIVGLIIVVIGVAINTYALTYHLVPLVGGVVVVTGQCLRMWALSDSVERKAIYAKAITISIGCILGLTYIINGADMLQF